MADSPQLSLSVGDRVVYPNQGVCRVSGVDTKDIAGQRLTFVTMKREEDGAVVMVPQTKVQSIGLRKVAGPADVEKIFAFLKSDSDKADLDWKQRARTNLDRMATGGVLGLAEVVKGLQVLSELRPLPTKERELYDNARHLLVTEIAAALGIPDVSAEDAIDVVLFPPGKERPKRTADEFKRVAGDDDDLDMGDDLMSEDDGDLGLPEADAEQTSDDEDEAPSKAALSDDEETQVIGKALTSGDEGAPRKRGRPPKAKSAQASAPKKPARAAKAKPASAPAGGKKRGRPPKAASEAKPKTKTAKKK